MLHLSMVYALLYCIQYSFIIDLINNVVIAAHFSEDEDDILTQIKPASDM